MRRVNEFSHRSIGPMRKKQRRIVFAVFVTLVLFVALHPRGQWRIKLLGRKILGDDPDVSWYQMLPNPLRSYVWYPAPPPPPSPVESQSLPIFTTDWVSGYATLWEQELKHLVGQPNVAALEIGSFEGRSAIWFLENVLTHESSSITCVDPFPGRVVEYFDHNVRVSGHADRVVRLRGMSQRVLRTMERRYDFIYIDGCHRPACALADIVLSWDLKSSGVMIIDDYNGRTTAPLLERPELAVDAFLQIFEPHYELREKGHQVIVRKVSDPW